MKFYTLGLFFVCALATAVKDAPKINFYENNCAWALQEIQRSIPRFKPVVQNLSDRESQRLLRGIDQMAHSLIGFRRAAPIATNLLGTDEASQIDSYSRVAKRYEQERGPIQTIFHGTSLAPAYPIIQSELIARRVTDLRRSYEKERLPIPHGLSPRKQYDSILLVESSTRAQQEEFGATLPLNHRHPITWWPNIRFPILVDSLHHQAEVVRLASGLEKELRLNSDWFEYVGGYEPGSRLVGSSIVRAANSALDYFYRREVTVELSTDDMEFLGPVAFAGGDMINRSVTVHYFVRALAEARNLKPAERAALLYEKQKQLVLDLVRPSWTAGKSAGMEEYLSDFDVHQNTEDRRLGNDFDPLLNPTFRFVRRDGKVLYIRLLSAIRIAKAVPTYLEILEELGIP